MNIVAIIGRLIAKPDLRYTQSNKAVVSGSIAVDRQFKNENGDKEVDFINFQVWGKQAENLAKYCDKGSMIAIKGEIRTQKWVDKEEKTRVSVFVLANSITFLSSHKNAEKEQDSKEHTTLGEDVFKEFGKEIEISDIDDQIAF